VHRIKALDMPMLVSVSVKLSDLFEPSGCGVKQEELSLTRQKAAKKEKKHRKEVKRKKS
jgi:hypothetical protein